MDSPPPLPRFEHAADELRRQEFARLTDAIRPTLASLRAFTLGDLRADRALMLERLGYTAATDSITGDLAVIKGGCKCIVTCAPPADTAQISQ